MKNQLHVSREMILQILYEYFGKREIYAQSVQHKHADDLKQRRAKSCEEFMQTCQTNSEVLSFITARAQSRVL